MAVHWLRTNLFSTPGNAALTIAALAMLAAVVPPVVDWALLDADWTGRTRADCTGAGACWVFVAARFDQFVYGFYPEAQRWRVDAFFALTALAVTALLWRAVPKTRALWIGVLGVFPVTALWLLYGGPGLEGVPTDKWGGMMLTLVVAGVGIAASLPIGIVLALGRRSDLPVIRAISICLIEIWRGVPLITVLFMASVMLPLFFPEGAAVDKLVRALIGVSLFAGAYMAEVVRGGLQSVPRGQSEAAAALGLGYWGAMAYVVLPQALRVSVPGIANVFIGLLKDTTLVLVIGLFDLLGIVQAALTDPDWLGFALEGYVFVAAVFWVACFALSRVAARFETRRPARPAA